MRGNIERNGVYIAFGDRICMVEKTEGVMRMEVVEHTTNDL